MEWYDKRIIRRGKYKEIIIYEFGKFMNLHEISIYIIKIES